MQQTTLFSLDSLLSSDAAARSQGQMDRGGVGVETRISIDVGQPDPASMPMDDLIAAAGRVLSTDRTALLYGDRQGYAPLRKLVAHKALRLESLEVRPDDVLITNGSGQAIAMTAQALVDRGDWILMDEASWGVRVFKGFGTNVFSVRWDGDGPIIADVEAGVAAARDHGKRIKMFYTIPNFQNPLGITAGVERRKAVLDLAIEHGFLILEDDAYVELRFEGSHIPSYYQLDESRSQVLRAGTFSKIFGAGIRLGWTMSSPELLSALTHYKLDGGTSPFSSRILTEYMRGHMFEHIDELIDVYRDKRDVMIGGLQKGLGSRASWSQPEGGFFVWVSLPEGASAENVCAACARRGVSVWNGAQFRWDGRDDSHIRLSYSFATLDEIEEGVTVLCEEILRSAAQSDFVAGVGSR
ncbi:MAG: PLP-dependent aminotransferase family protein [Chloroflexi bacterium]|nr:PLP-dependent aminotransferase family protein [Chloroflexota bacterium]